jgi:HEPN domain-containing protein
MEKESVTKSEKPEDTGHSAKPSEVSRKDILSIRMKLKHEDGTPLMDAIEALVKMDQFPGELVPDLVSAAHRTHCVTTTHLAHLVANCPSSSLYPALKDIRKFSTLEYATIFKRHYYPDIEETLCAHVYKSARDKDCLEFFSFYFDALKANGRQPTLDTLEVLVEDLQPIAQSNAVISKGIKAVTGGKPALSRAFLSALESDMMVERYQNAREVLVVVKARLDLLASERLAKDTSAAGAKAPTPNGSISSEPVKDAHKAIERHKQHRGNADEQRLLKRLDDSMTNYRKAAEAMLKAAFLLTVNKRPEPLVLDDLRKDLKRFMPAPGLPDSINAAIERIQRFANSPAHDNDDWLPSTEVGIDAVIESLDAIEKWVLQLLSDAGTS